MGSSKGKWSQTINRNKIKTLARSKQVTLDLHILLEKNHLITYIQADLENKNV